MQDISTDSLILDNKDIIEFLENKISFCINRINYHQDKMNKKLKFDKIDDKQKLLIKIIEKKQTNLNRRIITYREKIRLLKEIKYNSSFVDEIIVEHDNYKIELAKKEAKQKLKDLLPLNRQGDKKPIRSNQKQSEHL